MFELRTERLLLRTWQPADLRAFAALNGDRQVMEHFPSVMSRSQSDAMARRMQAHFVQFEFGYWVLERHEQPGLLGVLGLQQVAFAAPFTPAVEIGWRIQQAQVLAFTVSANVPSQALMQRLGMQHSPSEDFQHPLLPPGHPLRSHLLYRLRRTAWLEQQVISGFVPTADAKVFTI
jgi:RimJ/RimL family protein N-acetyltransferase